jgi:hypothetical protein
MYTWIWHHLPGRWPLKSFGCLVLFLGVVALLFFVVFPWVEPRLPWEQASVQGGSGAPVDWLVHAWRSHR